MKKILFTFCTLFLITAVSAQHQKVRAGFFKKWYIGAFEDARGIYSIAIDTISDYYDQFEDDDEGFWSEQYEYHYEVYDSLRLTITRDTVYFDNEIFGNVYTIKAKPKSRYYNMAARNKNNRTIIIIMYPEEGSGWYIYLSDTDKQGGEGIFTRRDLEISGKK